MLLLGTYRGFHGPGMGGRAQLPCLMREEAHFAAAMAGLSAHLRPVLGGVQIALVHSVCIWACTTLQSSQQWHLKALTRHSPADIP